MDGIVLETGECAIINGWLQVGSSECETICGEGRPPQLRQMDEVIRWARYEMIWNINRYHWIIWSYISWTLLLAFPSSEILTWSTFIISLFSGFLSFCWIISFIFLMFLIWTACSEFKTVSLLLLGLKLREIGCSSDSFWEG